MLRDGRAEAGSSSTRAQTLTSGSLCGHTVVGIFKSFGSVLRLELLRNDSSSGQGMTVKSGRRPRCHRRFSTLGHQKLVPVSLRSLGGRSWESAVLSFYLCTRCKSYKPVPKSTTALINVVSQGNRGRLLRRKTLSWEKAYAFQKC